MRKEENARLAKDKEEISRASSTMLRERRSQIGRKRGKITKYLDREVTEKDEEEIRMNEKKWKRMK